MAALGVHLLEQGSNFLGLPGIERVRLEQVEHQQAGLPLIKLVDQALDTLLLDIADRNGGSIGEGLVGPVALDYLLGFEAVEQRGDRGIGPGLAILGPDVTGLPERLEDLANGGLAPVPEHLEDVQLGVGYGMRRLGHDRSSRFNNSEVGRSECRGVGPG